LNHNENQKTFSILPASKTRNFIFDKRFRNNLMKQQTFWKIKSVMVLLILFTVFFHFEKISSGSFLFTGNEQSADNFAGENKSIGKFEKAKLEFWSFEKRIVIRILDYDTNTNHKRKHLAVWLRIGRRNIIF